MNLSGKDFWSALRMSVTDPFALAGWIIALRFSVIDGLMALGACAVLTTLMTGLTLNLMMPIFQASLLEAGISPNENSVQQVLQIVQFVLDHPLFLATLQFLISVFRAYILARLGRAFGGKGSFSEAFALFAWIQIVQVIILVTTIITLFVFPLVTVLIMVSAYLFYFYMLTYFACVLHGFKSVGRVFLAVALTEFFIFIAFLFV